MAAPANTQDGGAAAVSGAAVVVHGLGGERWGLRGVLELALPASRFGAAI